MSREISPAPEGEIDARDREIIDAIGIKPDPRHVIPQTELKELVRGTKADDTDAMERLVATRLHWIYDTYVSMEEVRERCDLETADIMQMGALATLEAGRAINDASPAINAAFHAKVPHIMGALLVQSKLVPTVTGEGVKITQMKTIGQTERIVDHVVLAPNQGDVMAIAGGGSSAPPDPEEIAERHADQEIIIHALKDLTPAQRYVVEARFGLGEFSSAERPASFRELGEHFNMSHQAVSGRVQRALAKLGKSYAAALRIH